MRTFTLICARGPLRGFRLATVEWKHDREYRPLRHLTLNFENAAKEVHEFRDDREPQPGASGGPSRGRAPSVKRFEDPPELVRSNARSSVRDDEPQPAVARPRRNRDLAALRELGSIVQEVENDLPQFFPIGVEDREARRDVANETKTAVVHRRLDGGDRCQDDLFDGDGLYAHVHLPGFDPGEIQEAVDEPEEPLGVVEQILEVLSLER